MRRLRLVNSVRFVNTEARPNRAEFLGERLLLLFEEEGKGALVRVSESTREYTLMADWGEAPWASADLVEPLSGERFLTAKDGLVQLWQLSLEGDLSRGVRLSRLAEHTFPDRVVRLEVCDGELAAATLDRSHEDSLQNNLVVFSLDADLTHLASETGTQIRLSASGSRAAWIHEGGVKMTTTSGAKVMEFPRSGPVRGLAWSPRADQLAFWSDDEVTLIDPIDPTKSEVRIPVPNLQAVHWVGGDLLVLTEESVLRRATVEIKRAGRWKSLPPVDLKRHVWRKPLEVDLGLAGPDHPEGGEGEGAQPVVQSEPAPNAHVRVGQRYVFRQGTRLEEEWEVSQIQGPHILYRRKYRIDGRLGQAESLARTWPDQGVGLHQGMASESSSVQERREELVVDGHEFSCLAQVAGTSEIWYAQDELGRDTFPGKVRELKGGDVTWQLLRIEEPSPKPDPHPR